MTMFPSACIWKFGIPMEDALRQVKETAFHYIDIETDSLETPKAGQAFEASGLKVSSVALDHKLPPGVSLDGGPEGSVPHLRRGLDKARDLGARFAYVGSCAQRKHLPAFGQVLEEAAEIAAQAGIRLCVEHVPGRALAGARETLAFIRRLGHPNLFLLLDVGHALLAGEKPWEIVEEAGPQLGYVHLNDNDGKRDRHWPLLDGRLTLQDLRRIIDALEKVAYQGTLGLELQRDFAGLISGLSRNRNLLLRIQQFR